MTPIGTTLELVCWLLSFSLIGIYANIWGVIFYILASIYIYIFIQFHWQHPWQGKFI